MVKRWFNIFTVVLLVLLYLALINNVSSDTSNNKVTIGTITDGTSFSMTPTSVPVMISDPEEPTKHED